MHQSFSLNEEEKIFCLNLARETIKAKLLNKKLELSKETIPKKLLEKKACFVTLTLNNNLRGCVGHLRAFQELYKDIIDNSLNSAFSDNRFPSLTLNELTNTKIEVSVLTDPTLINYSSTKELLEKITPKKSGLIIEKGNHSSTFLPSVWSELPTKKDFLTHLCLKAGLSGDEWKKNTLIVKEYYSIVFSE